VKASTKITVELDMGDALQVGLTMCATARAGKIHASAIEVYDRVGRALIKAVQELAQPATTEVVS
jgi:hypothetical protein